MQVKIVFLSQHLSPVLTLILISVLILFLFLFLPCSHSVSVSASHSASPPISLSLPFPFSFCFCKCFCFFLALILFLILILLPLLSHHRNLFAHSLVITCYHTIINSVGQLRQLQTLLIAPWRQWVFKNNFTGYIHNLKHTALILR